MRSPTWFLSLAFISGACSPQKEKLPDLTMEQTSNKIVIYQAMTRLFGNKVAVNKKYGTIEENGTGKFNDINDAALRGILELGATHVWYTGVIEHASLTDYAKYGIPHDDADVVKGRAGSPYAIRDYYDVSPDLAENVPARMNEFEELVARTHRHGLKVLIDFVPNHVARAYRSDSKPAGVKDLGADDDVNLPFHPNNNFYYIPGESFRPPAAYKPLGDLPHPTKDGHFEETPAKATGNDEFSASPGTLSWFETVKLNYGVDIQQNRSTHFAPVPDTWFKMRDILLFWASKNVDGFRCDMAEMVPIEFWRWVIPQVKEVNRDLIFIAEIYNPSQYRNFINGGFDFLYDKVLLYDMLRLLTSGKRSTAEIDSIQQELKGITRHMLHFMENHDEQRIASRFFAGNPWHGIPAMVISATIDQGAVMIYFGQETGEPGLGSEGYQPDDGRTTIFDYWGVPEHQKWMNHGKFDGALLSDEQRQLRRLYAQLLTFASGNRAIHSGEYLDITRHNIEAGHFGEDVHAFLRFIGEERLLIINSFNSLEKDIRIQLPGHAADAMRLDPSNVYIARDMLWQQIDIGFDKDLGFELKLKPFSSFIFKIK